MQMQLWIVAILLTPWLSQADSGRFDCTPDPNMPGYQIVKKDANTFSVRAHFPNNALTAPVFSGDLNLGGIENLLLRAERVMALGDTYTFDVPASQCIRKKQSDTLFYIHCFSKTPMTLGSQKLHGASFHATAKQVTSLSWSNGNYIPITDEQVTVGVEVGLPSIMGTHWMDLSRTYITSECVSKGDFWE